MIDKQRIAAKEFAEKWQGKGYERGQSQTFWLELLQKVFLVEDPFSFIKFEEKVKMTNTGFIDGRIPKTKVLIEQKSLEIDLKKEKLQSDGQMCTPFQQAKRYISALPLSDHPRWVVLSNFKSFLIFDMEQPNGEPFEVLLETWNENIKGSISLYLQVQLICVKRRNFHFKQESLLVSSTMHFCHNTLTLHQPILCTH